MYKVNCHQSSLAAFSEWLPKQWCERPGSDHVTLGPMRGLTKIAWGGDKHTDRQTHGHRNY